MLRFKGFAIGFAAGIVVTLALTAPWRATADERWYKVPGDVNGDGRMNIGDAIYILNYVFASGPEPVPCEPCPQCPGCDSCCPMLAGPIPRTGQTACFDSNGNEIPCDNINYPGQDAAYGAGCAMAIRFVDNGDGTVTDTCTDLTWQKETAPGRYSWQEALRYCDGLALAEFNDWRLPNIRELLSIADYGRWEPAIDPVLTAVPGWYWASSSRAEDPIYGWVVYFWHGSAGYGLKNGDGYVRAVRGPASAK